MRRRDENRGNDNRLYFGDNLEVMRDHIKDESVDLVYLDPPFNSHATYNVLFKEPAGTVAEAQAEAFRDTWTWGPTAAAAYEDVLQSGESVSLVMRGLRDWLGKGTMMAYITMMAVRLVELRRVLKPTGSLYLHCDQTASHYLKLILDAIFGVENYRNEIIWKRKAGRGETNREAIRFGVSTDSLLFYVKSREAPFHRQITKSNPDYIASKFVHTTEDGRRYRLDNITSPALRPNLVYEYKGIKPPPKGWAVSLDRMKQMDAEGRLYIPSNPDRRIQRKRFLDELEGETVDSLWADIPPINSQAQERLGYPTQKPLNLLKRILEASSAAGDVLLDPFCGCGTSVDAAESNGRKWIGIDVTHYAITLIEERLKRRHPDAKFSVHGRPADYNGACELARRDKHQFQWWAAWFAGAQSYREEKKGADRGIDGNAIFANGPYGHGRIIISVKGGENVGVQMVRDLRGVIEREEAEMGVLVSLVQPTGPMISEAAAAGFVKKSAHGRLPRLQIISVSDLFDGILPKLPPLPQALGKLQPKRRQVDAQLPLLLSIPGSKTVQEGGAFVDPRYIRFG